MEIVTNSPESSDYECWRWIKYLKYNSSLFLFQNKELPWWPVIWFWEWKTKDEFVDIIIVILAVLIVILNRLQQESLAPSFWFASVRTSFVLAIGTVGNKLFGVVAPISFRAETIIMVGTMGMDLSAWTKSSISSHKKCRYLSSRKSRPSSSKASG